MEIFFLPFMQRAFIGGIIISLLLAYVGIFAVLRKSSFFGDAVAHSSLTGVAIGVLIGIDPLLMAMFYAVFVAFILPVLRKRSQLHTDSLLGIVLPVSMAIGVVLLSFMPGYQPELISFLFGSILTISWGDILITSGIATILFIFARFYHKQLLNIAFDAEYSKLLGISVQFLDALYHVGLAIAIVVGIQLVGIVLVNALLIIPAATARLYALSLKGLFLLSPVIGVSTTVLGLTISYFINVPSGPAIALTSGATFLLAVVFRKR